MNLRKLPPSMLVVLGLSCTNKPPTVHPCLSQPYDPATEDVGPCLGMDEPDPTEDTTEPEPDTDTEPPVGPCLSPPQPQAMLDAQPAEPVATQAAGSRREALDRVLARATLPPDVAERLRQRNEDLD